MSLPKKLLIKQQSYLRDRLKRLELRQEAFEAFLGFRCIRDGSKLDFKRIKERSKPEPHSRVRTARSHNNEPRLVSRKSEINKRHRRGTGV